MLTNLKQKAAMFGLDARIAIVIISILGLLVFPAVNNIISNTKAEAILTNIRVIDKAIIQYIDDTGSYPNTLEHLFFTEPTDASQAAKWRGPYLKGQPTDSYMPSFTWTKGHTDCNNTATFKHAYCDMFLMFTFTDIANSVANKLAEQVELDSYDASTEILTFYYNKSGTALKYSYKIKELP